MAFNQAYGADAREGLNTVNGKRIYLGVGTAVNQFKIPLKHSDSQQGRWVNALRKSQLLAEIRAKQSYALNKKSTIDPTFV